MEAARGNNSYLDALVYQGDAYKLMQAVGLPFDWTSLKPEKPALAVMPGAAEDTCLVVVNESLGLSTKRSL